MFDTLVKTTGFRKFPPHGGNIDATPANIHAQLEHRWHIRGEPLSPCIQINATIILSRQILAYTVGIVSAIKSAFTSHDDKKLKVKFYSCFIIQHVFFALACTYQRNTLCLGCAIKIQYICSAFATDTICEITAQMIRCHCN